MPACGIATPAVFRQSSDVRVDLADRVLRYEITETFVNRGNRVGEADFIFPLPKSADFPGPKLESKGQMGAGERIKAKQPPQDTGGYLARPGAPGLRRADGGGEVAGGRSA